MNILYEKTKEGRSFISPSSSERWMNCPASVYLHKKIDDEIGQSTTKYAEQGQRQHEIFSELIQATTKSLDLGEPISLDLSIPAHANYKVLRDYFEKEISEIERIDSCWPAYEFKSEVELSLKGLLKGTCDILIGIGRECSATVYIIDYKSGYIPVASENNYQILTYLAMGKAFLDKYTATYKRTNSDIYWKGGILQNEVLTLTEYSQKDIDNHLDRIQTIIKGLFNRNPHIEKSYSEGKWCKYCPGFIFCDLKKEKVMNAMKNINTKVSELEESELLTVLENRDDIKQYIENVYYYHLAKAEKGDKIPGYKLINTKGRARWKPEATDLLTLLYGEKALKTELVGITAAKKLFGAETVEKYTEKGPVTKKLVKIDSIGEEVEGSAVFDDLD